MTFDESLKQLAPDLNLSSFEPLTHFPYPNECKLKSQALKLFYQNNHLDLQTTLIPSPMARNYRTISKRRASWQNGRLMLTLHARSGYNAVQQSELEPELHYRIYSKIYECLAIPALKILARNLNYLVLRGSYEKVALIINLSEANAEIIRKLRHLTDLLTPEFPEISAYFLYVAEAGSDYYLDNQQPDNKKVTIKKIWGCDFLDVKINGIKLLYPPTGFSQVNQSILGTMVDTVAEMLAFTGKEHLIDLYCGYGVLGLANANKVESLTAIDYEGPSVKAGAANAKHLFPDKRIKFLTGSITADFLQKSLPGAAKNEVFILDPPRNGCAPGVIETIAGRRPDRILHIFCNIDEVGRNHKMWTNHHYQAEAVKTLDMFPGTAGVETMILYRRKS